MKKKILISILATAVILASMAVGALAAPAIRILVDGQNSNVKFKIINGSTYLSLVDVAKIFDAKVGYSAKERIVWINTNRPEQTSNAKADQGDAEWMLSPRDVDAINSVYAYAMGLEDQMNLYYRSKINAYELEEVRDSAKIDIRKSLAGIKDSPIPLVQEFVGYANDVLETMDAALPRGSLTEVSLLKSALQDLSRTYRKLGSMAG
ncbi:hypothetical protein [Paenibacillus abyssi]|uniref:Copper amine oxidase-like N-terminal domain-containing protein n=1 Tax=Paenibacillus abyssi TaxID=1340531 RepID=A0A917LF84_9BACL|nr:hypothetical protein [Paenibacillus abyssi]GGG18022.1 hypothetical protein GCM10010916_38500 [Paenibacillus abyssi]